MSKITENLFSLLCKKDIKWGEVKKKKLTETELLNVQKKEWETFWNRFEQYRPSFKDKVVVDYGSGFGYDSLFILESGANHVYCLEVSADRLEACRNLHLSKGYKNCTYIDNNDVESLVNKIGREKVDIIICRDVMEHVPSPVHVLRSMFEVLKLGGISYIGFSPLYKSPYGPHISTYCKVPYVHIIFSEKTIISVLKRLYDLSETIEGYIDIPGSGVNKLSYFDYLTYLKQFDWKVEKSVKNSFQNRLYLKTMLNLLISVIPLKSMKELFIVSSYIKLVKS